MKRKSVLITGCSTGIGKDAALTLKKRGWRVFASARKEKDFKELRDMGLDAVYLEMEDSNSIKEAVNYTLKETENSLDAVVNNSGIIVTSAVEDLSRDELRKQFEVNVFGLLELTNLIIPSFRKQGYGRIINISSIAGKFSLPFIGAYSASKFALEALTDALRIELRNSNIHVSNILPGPIRSSLSKNAFTLFNKIHKKMDGPHTKMYEYIQSRRENLAEQKNKYPASSVTKKIIHALESSRPHIRYLVTSQAYFLYAASKLAPAKLIDFAARKYITMRYPEEGQ